MKYTQFHEQRFRASVAKALKRVQMILDDTRNPRLAEEVEHTYNDKYTLAALLTNTGLAAEICAMEQLGLDSEQLLKVCRWVHSSGYTGDKKKKQTAARAILRFEAHDTCNFLRSRDVEMVTGERKCSSGISGTDPTTWLRAMDPSQAQTGETVRIVNNVREYHWRVDVLYRIVIFVADSDDDLTAPTSFGNDRVVELEFGNRTTTIVTTGGQSSPPIAERTVHPFIDVDLTWFFRMISPDDKVCQFGIDREAECDGRKTCRTPRRNKDIEAAYEFNRDLAEWARRTHEFFLRRIENEILEKHKPAGRGGKSGRGHHPSNQRLMSQSSETSLEPGMRCRIVGSESNPTFNDCLVTVVNFCPEQKRYRVKPAESDSGLPAKFLVKPANLKRDRTEPILRPATLAAIKADNVFCPILPLMEKGEIMSTGDVVEFLNDQLRSIDEATEKLAQLFPDDDSADMVSYSEANIVLMCQHIQQLSIQYIDCIDYLEDGLRQELVRAIGREVSARDFDSFVRFHSLRVFRKEYAPEPFSYAIRRPNHFPDCMLSIEGTLKRNEPIETTVKRISGDSSPSFRIPIGAATFVEVSGDKYLHGWMQHHFDGKRPTEYQMVARSHHCSTCLVVIGTVAGPTHFDPQQAFLLHNKDEVSIPLQICVLPTDREFQDAMSSLSPEQKAFCKAFRGMQLDSSVFGFCVVQLKPQLERLLGLPDGALTKETQLTQDLISLFVDHHIPSDLLSFDGSPEVDQETKVESVRGYVQKVMGDIETAREKQLMEEKGEAYKSFVKNVRSITKSIMDQAEGVGKEVKSNVNRVVVGARGGDQQCRTRNSIRFAPQKASSESTSGAVGTSATVAAPAGGLAEHATFIEERTHVAFSMSMSGDENDPPGIAGTCAMIKRKTVMQKLLRLGSPMRDLQPAVEGASRTSSLGETDPSRSIRLSPSLADPAADVLLATSPFSSEERDFTRIPKLLDAKLEKYDNDDSLRSTILKAGPRWTRRRAAGSSGLLKGVKSTTLHPADIEKEKTRAFDLLDAVSRSGTLPVYGTELHLVVAVSHCFEKDVMGTIIQDNINPIAKVEKSALLVASTIHGVDPDELIRDEETRCRLREAFPMLFGKQQQQKPQRRRQIPASPGVPKSPVPRFRRTQTGSTAPF